MVGGHDDRGGRSKVRDDVGTRSSRDCSVRSRGHDRGRGRMHGHAEVGESRSRDNP